jgi:HEAT repeat protein
VEALVKEGRAFSEEQLKRLEEEREREREANAKFDIANQAIRSKNALQRIRGIRDLCAMAGAECVPMAAYLMQADADYSVRETAAISLGNLGPAAKSAIPNLKACVVQSKYDPPINATPAELEASMKQGDVIRACRDALAKVQR